MSLPVNSMQGLDSREPNHWSNLTLEPVPRERGSLWTPRQRVFSPIDESQRLVSKGEKQGFIAHLPLEKAWLAKGLRTYNWMPRFWMYY